MELAEASNFHHRNFHKGMELRTLRCLAQCFNHPATNPSIRWSIKSEGSFSKNETILKKSVTLHDM